MILLPKLSALKGGSEASFEAGSHVSTQSGSQAGRQPGSEGSDAATQDVLNECQHQRSHR